MLSTKAPLIGALAVMRRYALRLIPMICLLALAQVTAGAEFSVAISIYPTTFRASEAPHFRVLVRSTEPKLRFLDYKRRGDLLDSYGKMVIWREDASFFDQLIAFSDPGSFADADYVELTDGMDYSFDHTGYPVSLSLLAPGAYFAQLKLQRDWNEPPVQSNSIRFEVTDQ